MKILRNNLDRNLLLNTETSFGTDLGWEENIQEFEQQTLQSIINPAVNYETGRYTHESYVSNNGITQNDIWFQFYFYNNQTHYGGLNYEYVNITPQENRLLLRDSTESFFRLEFYKVPSGATPDRTNRRLVFSKNLTIPLGEKVYYTPVSDNIFVPIFVGSNFRNKENMYLYWFLDDSVLDGTTMTGDTFYMTARFFNAKDGSILNFANKPIKRNGSISESTDFYYKLKINQTELTYEYFKYTGLTDGDRIGYVTSPINFYEVIGGNETYNTLVWKGSNITDPDRYTACSYYNSTHLYYISGSTIQIGNTIYTNVDLTTPYDGGNEWLTLSLNGMGDHFSYLINNLGTVSDIYECPAPCGTPYINNITCIGLSDFVISFTNSSIGDWLGTIVQYSLNSGLTWTDVLFERLINPITLKISDNPLLLPVQIRIAKLCESNESDYSNVVVGNPIDCDLPITIYLESNPLIVYSWGVSTICNGVPTGIFYSTHGTIESGMDLYTTNTLTTLVPNGTYSIFDGGSFWYNVNVVNGLVSTQPTFCLNVNPSAVSEWSVSTICDGTPTGHVYSMDVGFTTGTYLYTTYSLTTLIPNGTYCIFDGSNSWYNVNVVSGMISSTPTLCFDVTCGTVTLDEVIYNGGNSYTLSVTDGTLGSCTGLTISYSIDGGTWVNQTVACAGSTTITTTGSGNVIDFKVKKLCHGTNGLYSNIISYNACSYDITITIL